MCLDSLSFFFLGAQIFSTHFLEKKHPRCTYRVLLLLSLSLRPHCSRRRSPTPVAPPTLSMQNATALALSMTFPSSQIRTLSKKSLCFFCVVCVGVWCVSVWREFLMPVWCLVLCPRLSLSQSPYVYPSLSISMCPLSVCLFFHLFLALQLFMSINVRFRVE